MKKKIIILLLFTSSCEHYSSNVEIIYKNPYSAGYTAKEDAIFKQDTPLPSFITEKQESGVKREEIKPLSISSTEPQKNSSSPDITPEIPINPAKITNGYHIVQRGETYYSVSRLYNIPPHVLMALNNYKANNILKSGDSIKLIQSSASSPATLPETYKSVKPLKVPGSAVKEKSFIKSVNPCMINFIFPIKQKEQIEKYKEIASPEVRRDGVIIKIIYEENVVAAADGKVVYVGNEFSDYGNLVIIRHANSYFSVYGYLKPLKTLDSIDVKKGEVIARTDISEGKFYFAIRKGKVPVNPARCISFT